jgi:hypothetical protein
MANSTSAICFLVVVMAIIVCLSMLVGLRVLPVKVMTSSYENEMYASILEGFGRSRSGSE